MASKQTERLDARSAVDLLRAAELLRAGANVAFPTETVYGLGGNAHDPAAVAGIFAAKDRPGWDPLIVHVADQAALPSVAQVAVDLQQRIAPLIARFWPGPLTLLLPRAAAIGDGVTAGRPKVGVRLPAHPVARALIRSAGVPVAAPSANRFGHLSPTTAAHVLADLDGRIDAVLDGGPTEVGVESTVLDPGEWPAVVYRPGAISVAMLEDVLGRGSARIYRSDPGIGAPGGLPSPGVGIRHYAPRARLVLLGAASVAAMETELAAHAGDLAGAGERVGVMLPDGWKIGPAPITPFGWGSWEDADELARRLFAGLRALDHAGASVIVCPVPAAGGVGEAIRDRLRKAAWPR